MKKKTREIKKVLILENIRSVYNVGAIFRTAEAIGIDKIFLVGYTPCPIDRFGRLRNDLHKAALGAEKNISWEKRDDIVNLIKSLKLEKFYLISLEQNKNSLDYREVKVKEKTAIIIGNEVEGVSPTALENSDIIAEIPMMGKKESLNVSVATGVFLFRLLN